MGADLNPEITAVTTLLARSRTLWEHTELRRPPGPSGGVCVGGWGMGKGGFPARSPPRWVTLNPGLLFHRPFRP